MTEATPNYCFIDGQNLETSLHKNNLVPNYLDLFCYLQGKYKVTKIYYCAKFTNKTERRKLFNKLRDIGYEIIFSSGCGNANLDGFHKVNVDADLIVKALKEYYSVEKFGLILISGDGDFIPLIRFFEDEKQFVKLICPDRFSTSKMLESDRFTKKRRYITFYFEELQILTNKISLIAEGGERDQSS
jgi:uncharacterized LabA/DUF88 family protein